ncbi:MAG TPA: 3-oxoacyl-ACP synthase [Chryseosolibacter sp.]
MSEQLLRIKKELYNYCVEYIQTRISNSMRAIESAREAPEAETKSSAGDKYETGRAMMQLQIEQHAIQLSGSMKLKQALAQISISDKSTSVQPGSVVVTEKEIVFIAISIGNVTLRNQRFVIVSPGSPLGASLMGRKAGDTFTFMDRRGIVKEVI